MTKLATHSLYQHLLYGPFVRDKLGGALRDAQCRACKNTMLLRKQSLDWTQMIVADRSLALRAMKAKANKRQPRFNKDVSTKFAKSDISTLVALTRS